jgi:tryptophan-rich sensory protein
MLSTTYLPQYLIDIYLLHRLEAYSGLKIYYIQLGLNLLWTPLFFGLKQVSRNDSLGVLHRSLILFK